MNYTSSHLANRRIREQNDALAKDIYKLSKSIDELNKTLDKIENDFYSNKLYSKRIFKHRITRNEYELSHFYSNNRIRKEIESDLRDFLSLGIPVLVICFSMISFVIYMFLKDIKIV